MEKEKEEEEKQKELWGDESFEDSEADENNPRSDELKEGLTPSGGDSTSKNLKESPKSLPGFDPSEERVSLASETAFDPIRFLAESLKELGKKRIKE